MRITPPPEKVHVTINDDWLRQERQKCQHSAWHVADIPSFFLGGLILFPSARAVMTNLRSWVSTLPKSTQFIFHRDEMKLCIFSWNHFKASCIGHLTCHLPEFFHRRLLFLSSGQMTRIIDWEKHNVPVCWKPSHEKWTVEVLVSNFDNLCGSDPRRWHWQDDQESPDSLQNHRRAGPAASLDSVFLAAVLRMSLCSIIPWKQERNTNVWKSGYRTATKEEDSRITRVLLFYHHFKRLITLARFLSWIFAL